MKIGLKKYFKGKGVDVSKKCYLENFEHKYVEPNNHYSLKEFCDTESLDFIYSKNLINETKFYRILIKEWLNSCKRKGYIIIEMKPNKILNFGDLVKECKIVLKDKGKIISKKYDNEKGEGSMVIKKIKNVLKKGDSIDKWTFGIISDGKKEDWTDKEIDSIMDLGIPHCEIIVCGHYAGKKKIKNILFKEKLAWITKKKNLICESAKYENIVVTHNRFIFDKNWYEGMKKYGNNFEVLSCVIEDLKGKRADGWITFGQDMGVYPDGNLGFLEYKDWDKNGYIDGGLIILKKFVWEKCPWDEARVWGGQEDTRLSWDFYKNGFVSRFNPFSKCITLKERGKWFIFKFNKKRFITPKDRYLLGRIKNFVRRFCVKYIVK